MLGPADGLGSAEGSAIGLTGLLGPAEGPAIDFAGLLGPTIVFGPADVSGLDPVEEVLGAAGVLGPAEVLAPSDVPAALGLAELLGSAVLFLGLAELPDLGPPAERPGPAEEALGPATVLGPTGRAPTEAIIVARGLSPAVPNGGTTARKASESGHVGHPGEGSLACFPVFSAAVLTILLWVSTPRRIRSTSRFSTLQIQL